MRPIGTTAALVVTVLLTGSACGGSDDDAGADARTAATATAAAPTPTATTLPAVTAPPTLPQTRDWTTERWDGGNVVGLRAETDGLVVVLDRYGWYQESGVEPLEGAELLYEPLVHGNTGVEHTNVGATLRTYLLAPEAFVGQVVNVEVLCATEGAVAAEIEPVSVGPLVADSAAGDLAAPGFGAAGQDALTFGPDGRVVRVVFSAGC